MADVEAALLTFLDDLGYTVTTTPMDLEQRLPVIRVRRIGGGGDRDNDRPIVSVQTFAKPTSASPRAHLDLAEQVEDRFIDLALNGPQMVDGVCLDEAAKDSGPVELPYPTAGIRTTETIYRLTTRR